MRTAACVDDFRQMADIPPVAQGKAALFHVLTRIRDHEHVGYYLGPGSQAFDLVTEAYATLTAEDVASVRRAYAPRGATKPRDGDG